MPEATSRIGARAPNCAIRILRLTLEEGAVYRQASFGTHGCPLKSIQLPKTAIVFHHVSTDDPNLLFTPTVLHKAWNKPEKAKEWRTKLEQMEDFEK